MAGGRGERMRASGLETAKPLVRVRGATLLEWNLFALLRAGLEQVVVSTPAALPEVGRFVTERLVAPASAAGTRLSVLEEHEPLGNVGCAGLLGDRGGDVLVVYADNLTTLDLAALERHHEADGAALTLAAHEEPFRIPYGELTISDGRVVSYAEKPVRPTVVCSGAAVLGARALASIAPDRPTGLVDLSEGLIRANERVGAFRHSAPWIDVNDAAHLERAEELVAANADAFELWLDAPDHVVDCALVEGAEGVLVERNGSWLSLPPAWTGEAWHTLDDFDPLGGANVRYRIRRGGAAGSEQTSWMSIDELSEREDITPVLRRAVAIARSLV
jgi:NDP-mannose synthase